MLVTSEIPGDYLLLSFGWNCLCGRQPPINTWLRMGDGVEVSISILLPLVFSHLPTLQLYFTHDNQHLYYSLRKEVGLMH